MSAKGGSDGIKRLGKFLSQLTDKDATKAIARALNRSATTVRKNVGIEVRKSLKLKAGDVKNATVIVKAKPARVLKDVRAALEIKPQPVRLYKFGAKEKRVKTSRGPRLGVTVNVKGRRKLVRGAFIGRLKNSGALTVYKRKGPGDKGTGKLKSLLSSSVFDIFKSEKFMDDVKKDAAKIAMKNITRELSFAIEKKAKRELGRR